jgi:ABC-type nitrate/sulfonate/bicarbonate transport system substrate-binding protein
MLREELASAGLTPERIAYFFHGLYPAIMLNNLVRGRRRNTLFKAPRPGSDAAVNKAIGSLIAFGARILPGTLVGSSIIAVASRK